MTLPRVVSSLESRVLPSRSDLREQLFQERLGGKAGEQVDFETISELRGQLDITDKRIYRETRQLSAILRVFYIIPDAEFCLSIVNRKELSELYFVLLLITKTSPQRSSGNIIPSAYKSSLRQESFFYLEGITRKRRPILSYRRSA